MASPTPNTNLGIFTVNSFHSIANIAAAAVSPQRGERVIFFNGRHSLRTHSAYVLSERESESVRRQQAWLRTRGASLIVWEHKQSLSNLQKSGSIGTVEPGYMCGGRKFGMKKN